VLQKIKIYHKIKFMLSFSELKKGTLFILDGQPYEVLEYNFMRMQQRKPVAQTKIKNLISGKVTSQTFHQSDTFKEAEVEKEEIMFIYENRGEYWFRDPQDPGQRFSLDAEIIGDSAKFLKKDLIVTAYKFNDKIINIKLPIKIDYKVKEAPPAVKGDTAQGGSKTVVLDNGLQINTPLFIDQGDIIRVNTDSGEYTERVEKAK